MDPVQLAIASLLLILFLCVIRLPIAFGLGVVGCGGLLLLVGPDQTFTIVANKLHSQFANFTFSAVPLFLLMGFFAASAGFTTEAFEAARVWLARAPGGLASAVVVASALFGACSGSGAPAAAALGRIAVPEMLRYGYDKGLATGVIAAATPMAALIPPSILMVIFGVVTETSISRLLIAGILPGIYASLVFMVFISLAVKRNRRLAPPVTERFSWRQRFLELRKVWGILVLFLLVIGTLYLGLATPTEAASFGAFGALLLALAQRKVGWSALGQTSYETVGVTAMVFLIAGMASVFSTFLTLSGAVPMMAQWVVEFNLDKTVFILGVIVLFVIAGCFLDAIAIILLTMPVLYPMAVALRIDMVWLGVMVVMLAEIGNITPPLGLSVYVTKAAVGDAVSLVEVFQGCIMFLFAWVIILATMMIFPDLALLLPNLMMGAER